jgi:hypothetical protein
MCGYSLGGYYEFEVPDYNDLDELTNIFLEYVKYEETIFYLTFFFQLLTFLTFVCIFVFIEKLEKRIIVLEEQDPLLEPLLAV